MSSLFRFAHLVRRPQPNHRDMRFTSTWRDVAGRGNGLTGPTQSVMTAVATEAHRVF